MASKWQTATLENAPLEIIDGDRGTNYPNQAEFYARDHCLFLNAGNVTTSGFNFSDCAFITTEKDNLLRKGKLVRNDVVLTTRGTIGNSAYFDNSIPFDHIRINSGMVILRAKEPALFSRYLYLFIRSALFHSQVEALRTGSAQPQLPIRDINRILIPIPPPDEQRAIAHILGTLDDKIELSRKMNETLEAMARALFKSWFVDFDPVRAKAEGRDTGLPKHIADLFPDSFEDSELGEIPKGWTSGKLGDVLNQRVERCVASAETAARPYVPIDCISAKSLFLTESKPGEEAQSSLSKFYKWDLLFGAMRPYFHKVCIAPFDGTTRTTAFVLNPRQSNDFAFATFLLHSTDTIDFATRHSTGSTIPYAVWSGSLENMPVVVPLSEIRKTFDRLVRPILVRIPEFYFQNRYIAALRDTLLPKLISGELQVKDAEHFIKEVI